MNAMFAIIFFGACVAAQTFDRTQQHHVSVTDLLRSAGLHGKHFGSGVGVYNNYDRVPSVYPRSYYNYINTGVDSTTNLYTLDELVRQPLFRQYVVLPFFRQHLSNRLFQYYLTTPLFQQYYNIPQFQTFFQNPYLFYKYIYPVVYNTESTIFNQVKTDSTYPYSQYESNIDSTVYPRYESGVVDSTVYPYGGSYNDVDSQFSQYGQYPYSRYYNQYQQQQHQRGSSVYPSSSIFDSLYNNRYQQRSHQYGQYQYPSIYGQQSQQYGSYGQQYGSIFKHHYPYTYVLDKIFKSFFVNRPQITEVVTDVKVQRDNTIDQQTYGKYLDPITGEYKYTTGDVNVVNERVVPVIGGDRNVNVEDILARRPVVDQFYGGRQQQYNVKDALFKRLYLNKYLSGDRKFDELYPEYSSQTLRDIPVVDRFNKFHQYNINGVEGNVDIDELIRTPVDSDILRRVPLTKDIKDFTLSKYDVPVVETIKTTKV